MRHSFYLPVVVIGALLLCASTATANDIALNQEAGVAVAAADTCCHVVGDINRDGVLDPMDAWAIVQCMYGLWPPWYCYECFEENDVNCDGMWNPLDVVYLINFLWKNGYPPCECSELP